ncbi:TspO/MBR family protein [Lacticigenium naphthae]|uniref:TspO/MBR family protein n=1 Tax=Lacticigenium naphthae TaxID=515351 RepID=UPI00040112BC|nr:TspO/MBR family protein [Lacticigenium naphthae]
MKSKTKAYINAILLVGTLIINGLGAFGLINGLSQKEVSDMYPTLITPAPSTFSIWSIIYTFLIVSIIVMIIKSKKSYYGQAIDEISYLFWISCGLNSVWIISFSYNLIGLSTLFIFAFLIVMILIVKKVGKIQTRGRWLLPTTFGLYSGWLFIATVVNIAAWLVKIEWDRFGIDVDTWSSIILLVAVGLTFIVLWSTKNALFPIPIAWAYFGIYTYLLAPEGFQGQYNFLQNIALIGIVLLIGISAIQFYKNQYNLMPDTSISID